MTNCPIMKGVIGPLSDCERPPNADRLGGLSLLRYTETGLWRYSQAGSYPSPDNRAEDMLLALAAVAHFGPKRLVDVPPIIYPWRGFVNHQNDLKWRFNVTHLR